MTRTLATWSFALLVIGAAIVDSTILAEEPTRQHANVDVPLTDQPFREHAQVAWVDRSVPPDVHPNLTAPVVDPFQRVRVLGANDARPQNRIELDGLTYRFMHGARVGGMPIELRAPPECTITVDGVSAKGPLRAFFPDGTYTAWSSCSGVGTPITVGPDNASPR